MNHHEKTIITLLLQDAKTPHITGVYLGARLINLGDEKTAELIWEMTAQEIRNRTESN